MILNGDTYIRLKFFLITHTAASDPIRRQLRSTTSSLSNVMKSHHILLRAVAEVLSRVSDKEISKVDILAIAVLPLFDTADIDSSVLIVEGLAEEAQIARSQHAIDGIVTCHEGETLAVLEQVAPDLGIAMIPVKNRGVAKATMNDSWFTIPELQPSVFITYPSTSKDLQQEP